MSKNKDGIMGSNSGKVGTVVAYKWKGKDVLRGYSRSIKNPRTPAQQLHRAKFKTISLLASGLLPMIKKGFRQLADKESSTETGLFVKSNWPLVEANDVNSVSIPLDRVAVSRGELPGVVFEELQLTDSVVSVTFSTVDREGTAGDDYVYLGVYCPTQNMSVLSAPVKRIDKRVQTTLPAAMLGKELHLYGFAVGSDFNSLHKFEASDSCYLGTLSA